MAGYRSLSASESATLGQPQRRKDPHERSGQNIAKVLARLTGDPWRDGHLMGLLPNQPGGET